MDSHVECSELIKEHMTMTNEVVVPYCNIVQKTDISETCHQQYVNKL